MAPVRRSKEKGYALYLEARDRQNTGGPAAVTTSAIWYCLGPMLCFSLPTVFCDKWLHVVLGYPPPSACLPAVWLEGCLSVAQTHGVLLQRLPATRTPGTQQFHCPWGLTVSCRPSKWLSSCESYAHKTVVLGSPLSLML